MESLHKIDTWRAKGHKIVFTNGCFDLLHPGHVQYLKDAAALGDKLVVGLNSDSSVARLKGENRPINDMLFRKYMLAALKPVDLVIVFEEDTPRLLIESIKPDLLVKGGDYTIDGVVGADLVAAYGGEVRILSFLEGYSSTSIIHKIISLEHGDGS
jgi:rfaE bifunctional protein nucleotidyltransferase chain/domain